MSIKRILKLPPSIWLLITILIISLFLGACSAAAPDITDENLPAPTATIEKGTDPTPTPEATQNPFGDWSEYINETVGFRFLYPTGWFGPEVYETEGALRIEVGSDQVYPYGTDRTEQITTIPDSYYVLIEYNPNTSGRTWDDFVNSGWIDSYLGLLEMEDGGSITTTRSLTIRVAEVNLGNFQGLEYIATLSDAAQTERFYAREIIAFDEDLNWLRITGFPNLVNITDPANWKNDYARVDQANLETFLTTGGINRNQIEISNRGVAYPSDPALSPDYTLFRKP